MIALMINEEQELSSPPPLPHLVRYFVVHSVDAEYDPVRLLYSAPVELLKVDAVSACCCTWMKGWVDWRLVQAPVDQLTTGH